MDAVPLAPYKAVADAIKEIGGDAFKYCYQCGMCETACPWNRVRRFSVRQIIHMAQLGTVPLESDDIWLCTTCKNCVVRCPRGVNIIEVMRALRRLLVPDGVVPASIPNLRGVMSSIASEGNPWRQPASARSAWAADLNVKGFTEGTDTLYFPCCTSAYDPRVQKAARATAEVLLQTGLDFGLLGPKEVCCGESARKAGNETLFKRLAKDNIKTFVDAGVTKIVVSSPHCYHTFKSEYSELKVNFEVVHTTQYLAKQVKDGKLTFSGSFPKKVAYHDPCYLGRHNGIYDEPRDVLRSIPGVQIVEMADERESALCCGGGGSRIWMETPRNERFSEIRLKQAMAAGADVLVTACPYCINMFEDARLSMSANIEVKDITEVVRAAM